MDLHQWRAGGPAERDAWAAATLAHRHDLRRIGAVGDLGAAVYAHEPTGLAFVLVPGGLSQLGMDEVERDVALALSDDDEASDGIHQLAAAGTVEVKLEPYLLGLAPIGAAGIAALLAGDPLTASARDVSGLASAVHGSARDWIGWLAQFAEGGLDSTEDAEAVVAALAGYGMRLPSEAEWEHAARAGTGWLTPTGNTVPTDPLIGINPLGFTHLGADAELCGDSWASVRAGVPADGSARPGGAPYVVRGGSASCYPWQDCGEWTLHLNASRLTSEYVDTLTIRPAMTR